MILELLRRFYEEYATIRRAPISFFLLLALLFIVGFAMARWHFSGIISEQQAEIQMLTMGSQERDTEIDRFRLKLNLTPAQTRLAEMSNAELIHEESAMVSELRSFGIKYDSLERVISDKREAETAPLLRQIRIQGGEGNAPQPGQQEVVTIWKKYDQELDGLLVQERREYQFTFAENAIPLRGEMASRLPKDTSAAWNGNAWHGPYFVGSAFDIAADLEFLAKSLPRDRVRSEPIQPFAMRDELAVATLAGIFLGWLLTLGIIRLKRRMQILADQPTITKEIF
jgi:hypothetical protein